MIRVWLVLVVLIFVIRLIRSHMAMTRKIIIGIVTLILVVGGYIVYSQLFSIEADNGQIISALSQADNMIVEYRKKTGREPTTVNDVETDGAAWPKLAGGYRLADGYNLTSNEVTINKVAERNCGAWRAAVTINYQPYDLDHVRLIIVH